jgi:polar amino acid transport system permease protein
MDDGMIVEQGPPASVLDQPSQDRTRRFPRMVNKVEEEVA